MTKFGIIALLTITISLPGKVKGQSLVSYPYPLHTGDACNSKPYAYAGVDSNGQICGCSNNTWSCGGGSGTPGGSDTAVQINNTGTFFGDAANFFYNKTTHLLTATGGFSTGCTTSIMDGSTDGYFKMTNNAGTDFTGLRFGGTTSSFPMWKRSGAGLVARLADDSANANITVNSCTGCGGGSGGIHTWYQPIVCGPGGGGSGFGSVDFPQTAGAGGNCWFLGFGAATIGAATFVNTSDTYILFSNILPASFSTVTVTLYVFEGATGAVKFSLETLCVADGGTVPSYNAAQSVTHTAASTWQVFQFTPVTTTGCSAGNFMRFKLHRDTSVGSNMADVAYLHGLAVDIQ